MLASFSSNTMGFTRGTGRRLAVTRWASLEKQELLILNLPAVCCGVHVAQSLFFCVVFCEPLFSLFFFISFGRYIVCPYGRYIVCPYGRFTSSHYPFGRYIVCPYGRFTASHYPFGIFNLF